MDIKGTLLSLKLGLPHSLEQSETTVAFCFTHVGGQHSSWRARARVRAREWAPAQAQAQARAQTRALARAWARAWTRARARARGKTAHNWVTSGILDLKNSAKLVHLWDFGLKKQRKIGSPLRSGNPEMAQNSSCRHKTAINSKNSEKKQNFHQQDGMDKGHSFL